MSAPAFPPFRLVHDQARQLATAAIWRAPDGWLVKITPPRRSLDQNAKFHALCEDIAKSGYEWAGCRRTAEEWKVLLITGHSIATGRPTEVVPNLEDGSPVQLRESSAAMSKERGSSLIEYTIAWATSHGIRLREAA